MQIASCKFELVIIEIGAAKYPDDPELIDMIWIDIGEPMILCQLSNDYWYEYKLDPNNSI